jgi:osmotically-inducible protein OsmY
LPAWWYTDSDKDRSSPKAFIKDSVITAKIKAEMAKVQRSARDIKVDTDNKGVVERAERQKAGRNHKAVQIANGVKGVTAVETRSSPGGPVVAQLTEVI